MPRLLKILLYSIGGLIALLVLAMVAVLIFVDPNDYKDDITAAVQKHTGRELILQGDLSLSVFPWLGVSLGAAQLSNAQGFGDTPFARVENVNIKIRLLPLLKKQLEMQTIQLRGLQVQLVTLANGHTNWGDLGGGVMQGEAASPASRPSSAKSAAMPLAALAIGGIDIEAARLDWDDRQAGQRIVVDHLNIHTGEVSLTEPVELKLSTDLSLSQPALNSHIEFAGIISHQLDAQQYRIDDMTLSVRAAGDTLPVNPLTLALSADVAADLARQQVAVNALRINVLDLVLQGQVDVSQLQTTPTAQLKLTMDSFSPRELMSVLNIAVPETADSSVLGKATLATELSASAQAVNISKLALVLDDTTLTGTASVDNFQQPAIEFDVLVDAIDVDRYLPPPADAATPPPTPGTAAAGAAQLPLEPLRQLNLAGQIKVGRLKVAKLQVADVLLGLKADGGQLRAHPVQAQLYNGQYSGNIGLDVRTDTPKLSLNEKLTTVAIGPLLKDMLDDDLVTGTADLSAVLTASGIEPDSLMKTLNGTAAFGFRDGAVKGVNLGQMIREANARLKGQPAPPKAVNQTDFAEISGSVDIKQGVVSNQDLSAKTPLLRLGGKGTVDLPRQKIDYRLDASVVNTAKGQSGADLDNLKAVTIPIKVSGSFSEPKFSLDLQSLIDAETKAKLEEKKDEVKQKLEQQKQETREKVKDKLQDKLKKLF